MDYELQNSQVSDLPSERATTTLMTRVFAWMFIGLALTAGIAAYVGSDQALLDKFNEQPLWIWGIFALQLVLVLVLSVRIEKLSFSAAVFLFSAYAALNGFIFAVILQLYTTTDVVSAFAAAAGMFGAMALFGYVTKKDLTGMGQILFMALIGLIIASIINLFVASSALYWIVTYAGVIIFAGLTAYDIQKIKQMQAAGMGQEKESNLAIMGALALYLDFINLFLFMLRIFGGNR